MFAPGELNQETRRNLGNGYVLVEAPLRLLHAEDEPVLQVRALTDSQTHRLTHRLTDSQNHRLTD